MVSKLALLLPEKENESSILPIHYAPLSWKYSKVTPEKKLEKHVFLMESKLSLPLPYFVFLYYLC